MMLIRPWMRTHIQVGLMGEELLLLTVKTLVPRPLRGGRHSVWREGGGRPRGIRAPPGDSCPLGAAV